MTAQCHDCARPYGHEHGFPDLIIPYWAWKQISPSGDDGGLLCPSCICKRLNDKGIRCEGAFASGPIISVSDPTMNALRRVENIELAIDGRNNRWAAAGGAFWPLPGCHLRGPVICAWGAHGAFMDQDLTVLGWLDNEAIKPVCLGLTHGGHPKHPLYVRADAPLIPFKGRRAS